MLLYDSCNKFQAQLAAKINLFLTFVSKCNVGLEISVYSAYLRKVLSLGSEKLVLMKQRTLVSRTSMSADVDGSKAVSHACSSAHGEHRGAREQGVQLT